MLLSHCLLIFNIVAVMAKCTVCFQEIKISKTNTEIKAHAR